MFTDLLKKKEVEIFGISFLILFLELSLIRLFPAQIALLGLYANFILVSSFAGIGLGLLLSRYQFDLRKIFPWFFLGITVFLSVFQFTVTPNSDGTFAYDRSRWVIPEFVAIPLVFLLVSALFGTLSQRLGKLFDSSKPLQAYKWDILGSLTGIALFSLLSYFGTSPIVWLTLFMVVFILLLQDKPKTIVRIVIIFVISLTVLYFGIYKKGELVRWSPYQKLTLLTLHDGYNLLANNIPHQFVFKDLTKDGLFYPLPYQVLKENNFEKALIIGAGMGNDVAMALQSGVKEIDAVDIDPVIYELGVKFNPHKVYQNPAVNFYNADGRAFLSRTKNKYDLIVFALPDSMVLAAGRVNFRLEGYLFTLESFSSAKEHLNPDGLVVLYNYYRQPFIIDKLTLMMDGVFGRKSYVYKGGPPYYPAAIMNGGALDRLKADLPPSVVPESSPPPATDDWPFLYMQKHHITSQYLVVLSFILALTYFLISKAIHAPLLKTLRLNYFFLGVGFFLLETKAVIQFSLLFGSTWFTNSLVFMAILTSVFLATLIAGRVKKFSLKTLYLFLFAALLVQYFFPLKTLLTAEPVLRYLIISVITFAPVFFANIIFSFTFKLSKENSLNFASNMFGAVVGGALEYTALILGYRQLVLVIAICYFLAFASPKKLNFSFLK